MKKDRTAAASGLIWSLYCVTSMERGRVWAVAKNDTAEMVTMAFKKEIRGHVHQRFSALGQKHIHEQAEGRNAEDLPRALQIGIQFTECLVKHEIRRCEKMDRAGKNQNAHGSVEGAPLKGQNIGKAQHQPGDRQCQGGEQMHQPCGRAPLPGGGVCRQGRDHRSGKGGAGS